MTKSEVLDPLANNPELHCLQKQGISRFSRTRVKEKIYPRFKSSPTPSEKGGKRLFPLNVNPFPLKSNRKLMEKYLRTILGLGASNEYPQNVFYGQLKKITENYPQIFLVNKSSNIPHVLYCQPSFADDSSSLLTYL